MTGRDERATAPRTIEEFECAAPQYQRFRFVGAMRSAINDSNWHSIASELQGERHSDRARTGNENLGIQDGLRPGGSSATKYWLVTTF
jgi:hypothetical protein